MLVVPTAADTGSLLAAHVPVPVFADGSSLAGISQRGVVRIAVTSDAAGFCKRNMSSGRLEGVDATLARRMAQGIFGGSLAESADRVVFVDTTLADRVATVCDHEVDFAIAVFAATSSRRKIMSFTSAYYGTSLAAFVRQDSGIESVADLSGARLAVLEGTEDEQYASRQGLDARVRPVASYSALVSALVSGEVDAVLAASAVFNGYSDIWSPYARRLQSELGSYQYAIAMPKGDDGLRSFLDSQVLEVMQQRYVSLGDAGRRIQI